MSYTPPVGNAINVTWQDEAAYTPPAGNAVNVAWPSDTVTGDAAVTLDFTAAAAGSHGVAGSAAVTLDLSADAAGTYTTNVISGSASVSLDLTAAATGSHGVSGASTATLDLAADAAAGHGVSGVETSTLDISAQAGGAHGVSAAGACTLDLAAAAAGTVFRYEVAGRVQQGAVLLNRHVRVYSRASGALLSEGDTVVGRFRLHAGFAAGECYIVPLDMADGATDYLPPTANRVLSILAQDV